MTWTNKKQQRLDELEQELAILRIQQTAARRAIAEAFGKFKLTESDIDHIISCADAIRDALQPFDSGVRSDVWVGHVSLHDELEDVPFPKGVPV